MPLGASGCRWVPAVNREGEAAQGWHSRGRSQAAKQHGRPGPARIGCVCSSPAPWSQVYTFSVIPGCSSREESLQIQCQGTCAGPPSGGARRAPGTCRLAEPPEPARQRPALPGAARLRAGAAPSTNATGSARSVRRSPGLSLLSVRQATGEDSPRGWARGMLLSPGTAIPTRKRQAARHSRSWRRPATPGRDLPGPSPASADPRAALRRLWPRPLASAPYTCFTAFDRKPGNLKARSPPSPAPSISSSAHHPRPPPSKPRNRLHSLPLSRMFV